jgi:hypothetical protein
LSERSNFSLSSVAFDLKDTLNWFSNTHGARNIKTENNRDILSRHLLVLDLRSCLNEIADSILLGYFFVDHINRVLKVAELAYPFLRILFRLNLALVVKHGLTILADFRIASGNFSFVVSQTSK